MSGIASVMREVHRLRRHAGNLQEELERIPRQLRAQQARVTREETALKDGHEAIKRLKVTTHEKEVTLKATLGRVEKHQRQLREATASKEYEALQKEIATEKADAARTEDEILAAMAESDEFAARLPALEASLAKARQDYAAYEKGVAERQAGLNAQLAEANAQIKQVEEQIPEKFRSQYNRLVGSMGADALAAVTGHTCGACHTEITAQSYHDLQRDQFVSCKSCYRFLYLAE
jgi:predicted  nucleic acid-binding Zn-ribbon protein